MKEALGMECLSEEAQCGRPLGRAPLLGTPKDMLKRYITRDVKMPCKWVTLPIVVLLGNLEGICLLGISERKDNISRFLSWTQRTLRF